MSTRRRGSWEPLSGLPEKGLFATRRRSNSIFLGNCVHSCLHRRALKLKPHAAVLKIMMTAMATYPTFLALEATS